MRGFFAGSTLASAKAPTSLLPKCGACGLYKGCSTPKMAVQGKGRKGILIVGEFPTGIDDDEGMPFCGKGGRYLQDALAELGINLRVDCWMTNALICSPPKGKIPDERMVGYCRPNIQAVLKELQPNVIILLGPAAIQSVIGLVWKEEVGAFTRWIGWTIPCQKPNVWICPTWSPQFLLRDNTGKVFHRLFKQHLEKAVEKTSKPWDVLPDYESQIEIILDSTEAARVLRKMRDKGGAIAFDYENNCLKPETPGGSVVCASACWQGKKTISYPWHGEAITATGELLHADNCAFIASNLKHEQRWTKQVFGRGVRHWLFDTMLAAHVLDNRQGICSLKFQSFVQLGAEAYDDHIKQFLRSDSSGLNQITTQIDLRQLLLYCGTDTLLEYLLADIQMKKLNISAAQSGDWQ